jgi:hypothetical protein
MTTVRESTKMPRYIKNDKDLSFQLLLLFIFLLSYVFYSSFFKWLVAIIHNVLQVEDNRGFVKKRGTNETSPSAGLEPCNSCNLA